jgi:F0F1-type ATP synthase assembly protein I
MFSLAGMGFSIAIPIVGGIWGGHLLDEKLNTNPLLLIVGLLLGIAVAALGVYNMIKPFIAETKKEDSASRKNKDNQ